MLQPGDKILTMSLQDGGHLTHGHPKNCSGMLYEVVNYGVSPETGRIDYDSIEEIANREKPKLITVGASAYPRTIDFERMGAIAKSTGALLLADIAHIAGLVAAGLHPSPVPHADFVTTTTHKTLRGPRGGLIMCKEEYGKAIDSAVFPGNQGGPLMHVIAAKAICFGEALKPSLRNIKLKSSQMPRLWPVAYANSAFIGKRRKRQSFDACRPAPIPSRPHRQAGSDRVGRSQRHPQPKHRSRRNPQPVSNQRTENRNSGGYFKGDEGTRNERDRIHH